MKTLLLIALGMIGLSSCSYRYTGHFTSGKKYAAVSSQKTYAATPIQKTQTPSECTTAASVGEDSFSNVQNTNCEIPEAENLSQKHPKTKKENKNTTATNFEKHVSSPRPDDMEPHKMVTTGTRLMIGGAILYGLFVYATPWLFNSALMIGTQEVGGLIGALLIVPAWSFFVCGIILLLVGGVRMLTRRKQINRVR